MNSQSIDLLSSDVERAANARELQQFLNRPLVPQQPEGEPTIVKAFKATDQVCTSLAKIACAGLSIILFVVVALMIASLFGVFNGDDEDVKIDVPEPPSVNSTLADLFLPALNGN